jgi:hypothetical protein
MLLDLSSKNEKMKKIKFILIVLSIALTNIANSQNLLTLKGKVINEQNQPIEAANISIFDNNSKKIDKVTITDKDGSFAITTSLTTKFTISISSLGYKNLEISALNLDTNISQLKFVLFQAPNTLKSVEVSTKKPMIELKSDKMVVNVESFVSNVGATALEVLEKSPGIQVDKDGNISLKGKSSVLVMIDGRPSYLGGSDLANLLSTMNSNSLSQIEIITNPGAKYDASGNAGVINIRTKKSLTNGFNGNVNLSLAQGVYSKINNSLNLNYRKDNLNTYLNYGYSLNNGYVDVIADRKFVNGSEQIQSGLYQTTNNRNKSENNNIKIGMDYFIKSQTSFGFYISGFNAPQERNGYTIANITNANNIVSSIEKTVSSNSNVWKNQSANLYFHSQFDNNKKEINANFDYLHYDFSGNQSINGFTYSSNNTMLSSSILKNKLPLVLNIYSGKYDYSHALSDVTKFEAGLKSSIVTTDNSTLFYKNINEQFDNSMSNSFEYKENINAAYVLLSKKVEKFNYNAGLRLENTNYSGIQNYFNGKIDSNFSKSYINFFPTALINYEFNNKNALTFSVGRRIDRPAYQQLNPFVSIMDKYMRMSGNPYLQPQISNNFELAYTFDGKFTTTINYGIIDHMINETMTQIDSLIIRSMGNIGTRYNYGISQSATFSIGKNYNGILFANLFNNVYDGLINGYSLKASQTTFTLNLNNQFSLGSGLNAELSGTYSTKSRDEGQAISLSFGTISGGISKQILNNKGSLKFAFRDLLHTQIPKEIQNFQNVRSTLERNMDTRIFSIAFVYRFGIQQKPKSSSQGTEEQKRVQIN